MTGVFCLCQVTDVALRYHSCCSSEDGASAVPRCCQSLLVSGWTSADSSGKAGVCELCVNRSAPVSHCWALGLYLGHVEFSSTSCRSVQSSYSPFGQFSVCCRSVPRPRRCPLLLDSITGLQCRTNKTLHFYLLDAELNWPLAQRLGASGNHSGLPFITIINLRDETHYVLKHTDSLGTNTEHTHTHTSHCTSNNCCSLSVSSRRFHPELQHLLQSFTQTSCGTQTTSAHSIPHTGSDLRQLPGHCHGLSEGEISSSF